MSIDVHTCLPTYLPTSLLRVRPKGLQADFLGAAPLHLAAEQGCPPVVQYLLEVAGAEISHWVHRCHDKKR